MFTTITINLEPSTNVFKDLSESITFEKTAKTRQVANLVQSDEHGHLPIVRTTTSYRNPVQSFSPAFLGLGDTIVSAINSKTGTIPEFNNAMVEVYEASYQKMGFHTDHAQDLTPDSYICIFSCYENNKDGGNPRLLVVKEKQTGTEQVIEMRHGQCILFSTATNALHVHSIMGNGCKRRWLGVTFRLSKTFVERRGDELYFAGSDKLLRRATEEETLEMRKCKSMENSEIEYVWPEMDYTISEH
jgi:hypothetical protein